MHTRNFENSAMKTSFSLSSLPVPVTPERTAPQIREFCSLKKRRNESTKRLSWGSSTSEQKYDFWSNNLKENYDYIMDNQLIENCQDANCEINSDPRRWSIEYFNTQCSELYSWLNRIQEKVYGHKTSLTDKTVQDLRSVCKNKLLKKRALYKLCKEQARKLAKLLPERKDEFNCQINMLKETWVALETLLDSADIENDDDTERKILYLSSWFFNMEFRLKPVSLRKEWTSTEKQEIISVHEVIYKDIENHKKIINSLKLCKGTNAVSKKVIGRLERRWLHLKLLSEEWQYYIEEYIKKDTGYLSDNDFCKEPVKKHPRLNSEVAMKTWNRLEDNPTEKCPDTIDGKLDCTINEKKMLNSNGSEAEQFNTSNRNAPNLGIYYFKHVDTDSDMEHLHNNASENEVPANSETSEEEWFYSANKDATENGGKKKMSEIERIFQELEELVNPDKRPNPILEPPINKTMRIKEWLKIDKPDDSCDASSEDEDNDSSESSEDQNESIATCRLQSLNASSADLDVPTTPKVPIRHRYAGKGKGQRPSSIACISQLAKSSRISNQPHSNSESALHKLKPDVNLSISNSTSSTVEDSCAMQNDEYSSPLRKKRFKLKKKSSVSRKSDLNSSPYNSPGNRERGTLIKSGSFSGRSCLQLVIDRQTGSDSTVIPTAYGIETSTTSGADSDEEKRTNRLPLFKIGAKTSYGLFADENHERFGIEEQSSSLCDDAWDSYQEKYSSEAYSEAHDSDAARKLLEFGEDYRSYLGSQSDWSTQSSQFSPLVPKRRTILPMNIIDSDTEASDLKELLKDSEKQCKYTEEVFIQQQGLSITQYLPSNDIKELLSTCDRHISCIAPVEKYPEEYKLTTSNKKEISDLLLKWNTLKNKISKLEEYIDLQNDISKLKRALSDIKIPENLGSFTVNNIEDLNRDVDLYSEELAIIDEHKKKLLKINVAVNHFMTENTEYNGSTMKSDVSELYRIWFEVNNRASDRINRLNSLLQSWQVLETRLDQLRGDLRDDEQTLGALDSALQGGTFSNQMASSVRGVAKVLSETKTEGCSFPEIFMEGSFSDSGISDEGSEHDLGERERRLSAIRRLVRQLEIVMAPDCIARVRMRDRLIAAEEELKSLQNKCRSIIVRTAVSATAPLSETVVAAGPGGDPDEEPTSSSWLKRVVRASISFQFAIVALLFVACLLDPPGCCDNMNNLQMSMNPQLHYVRGPPPI